MDIDLKKRILAFNDLGILFNENFIAKNDKTFPEWDSILDIKLKEAKSFNSWFTHENIKLSLKNWSNQLKKRNLENWISNYNISNDNNKTIAIIMAGNIPIVGFHDLLCSMLLNYKCIVKLSSEDKVLIPFIVDFLKHRYPLFSNKVTFEKNKLKDFDAVIATGSSSSHKYFEYYFSKYPNLIRKTRHSVAVLDGNESDNDLGLLSNDIFNYFGLGCRSVSKIFVPKGYDLDLLFNAFFKHKEIINHNKYVNNFDYNKAVFLMSEEKFIENGFIILKQDPKLGSPIGCLYYEEYEDVEKVYDTIRKNKEHIQCIVSNNAIDRFTNFGSTQCPKLDDYADNVDTVKFLLKI